METIKNDNPFEIYMNVTKSFTVEENGVTKKRIRGIASGPRRDKENHSFSRQGLLSIKKAIEDGFVEDDGSWTEIPLVYEHENKWDSEIGWVTKAEIDGTDHLWIEAELDESSLKAQELYRRLTTPKRNGKPRQYGLSVQGLVTEYREVWDEEIKKSVPVFDKMRLNEISVTSQPCYQADAYLAIVKSLQGKQSQENNMVNADNSNVEDQTQVEQAEVVQEIPMPQVNVEEQPAEETAVEPGTAGVEVQEETVRAEPQQDDSEVQVQVVEDDVAAEEVPVVEAGEEPAVDAPEVPEGYAVHPQNVAADVVEVKKSLSDLVEKLSKLEGAIDTLMSKEGEEVVPTIEEGETVEVQKSENVASDLDDRIESIVAKVFGKFTDELNIMKSLVEEIAGDPADKSISIVKSKSISAPETPEQFRLKLIEEGESPIKAGLRAAYEFNQERG